jgi:hypothetical protein
LETSYELDNFKEVLMDAKRAFSLRDGISKRGSPGLSSLCRDERSCPHHLEMEAMSGNLMGT